MNEEVRYDVEPDGEPDMTPAPVGADPASQAAFASLQPTAGKPGSPRVNLLSELWKRPLSSGRSKQQSAPATEPVTLSTLWKVPIGRSKQK